MRRYESVVILDPEIADEDIRTFTEKYTSLIKSSGGEIIKIEDWGFKRLAYPVKKRERGRYLLFDFVGLPALITELERQFKISEDVIKFLSSKVDDEVDLEAFKAAEKVQEAASVTQMAQGDEPIVDEPKAAAFDEPLPENESGGTTPGVEANSATGAEGGYQAVVQREQTALATSSSMPSSLQETEKEGR